MPAYYDMLRRWLRGSQRFTVRAAVDGGQPYLLTDDQSYSFFIAHAVATGRRVAYAYCFERTSTEVVSAPASVSANLLANERFGADAAFFCPQPPTPDDEMTSASRKAARRPGSTLRFTFPNGTKKTLHWTMTRPTSSRPLTVTSEVSDEFRYVLARDALQQASVVDLVARTPDARHASIWFEDVGDGRVHVHIRGRGQVQV